MLHSQAGSELQGGSTRTQTQSTNSAKLPTPEVPAKHKHMNSKNGNPILTEFENEMFTRLSAGALVSEICEELDIGYHEVTIAATDITRKIGRPIHEKHQNDSAAPVSPELLQDYQRLGQMFVAVTREVAAGTPVWKIARTWKTTPQTVGRHLDFACYEVNVQSIADLVKWAIGTGLVSEQDIDYESLKDPAILAIEEQMKLRRQPIE